MHRSRHSTLIFFAVLKAAISSWLSNFVHGAMQVQEWVLLLCLKEEML